MSSKRTDLAKRMARGPKVARRPESNAMVVETIKVARPNLNSAPRTNTALVAVRSPGGQVTAEDGYFDTERSATAVPNVAASWTGTEMDPNTSAMLCLFAPVQGDDISNRRARKVFVKKIRISGQLGFSAQSAQAAGSTAPIIRILVYQDKQTNGAQVSPATLMGSGNGSDAVHMFQSTAGFGRFKMLKDKTYVMNPLTLASFGGANSFATSAVQKEFSITVKPNCWVNYNATNGGTVADVIDNSFHLAVNCSQTGCVIQYKVRTVFSP